MRNFSLNFVIESYNESVEGLENSYSEQEVHYMMTKESKRIAQERKEYIFEQEQLLKEFYEKFGDELD